MEKSQNLVKPKSDKFKYENLNSQKGRFNALVSVGIIPGTIDSEAKREFANNQIQRQHKEIINQSR